MRLTNCGRCVWVGNVSFVSIRHIHFHNFGLKLGVAHSIKDNNFGNRRCLNEYKELDSIENFCPSPSLELNEEIVAAHPVKTKYYLIYVTSAQRNSVYLSYILQRRHIQISNYVDCRESIANTDEWKARETRRMRYNCYNSRYYSTVSQSDNVIVCNETIMPITYIKITTMNLE